MAAQKRSFENSWFWRRVATFGLLIFFGFILLIVVLFTKDAALSGMLISAMIATHQGYVGWAVADDKNVVERLGKTAFTGDGNDEKSAPDT